MMQGGKRCAQGLTLDRQSVIFCLMRIGARGLAARTTQGAQSLLGKSIGSPQGPKPWA